MLFIGIGRNCFNVKTEIFEKSLKFAALMFYVYAIFYAHNVNYFDTPGVSECEPQYKVTQPRLWVEVEIMQFYQGFFTATLFALLAKLFGKKKDFEIITG